MSDNKSLTVVRKVEESVPALAGQVVADVLSGIKSLPGRGSDLFPVVGRLEKSFEVVSSLRQWVLGTTYLKLKDSKEKAALLKRCKIDPKILGVGIV